MLFYLVLKSIFAVVLHLYSTSRYLWGKIFPFNWWGNCGSKCLKYLPKIIQLQVAKEWVPIMFWTRKVELGVFCNFPSGFIEMYKFWHIWFFRKSQYFCNYTSYLANIGQDGFLLFLFLKIILQLKYIHIAPNSKGKCQWHRTTLLD